MAVEITPLGYQLPDGATELVRRGADVIAGNGRKNQEHIAAIQGAQAALQAAQAQALAQAAQDREELAALKAAQRATATADFDGGTPSTVYVEVQTIDGGTV